MAAAYVTEHSQAGMLTCSSRDASIFRYYPVSSTAVDSRHPFPSWGGNGFHIS